MSKAILVVRSAPASAEVRDAYNDWYDNTHLPEMLALDGFTAARRYESADGASYLAVYDIDTDIETAKATFAAARAGLADPVGMNFDPPPTMEYYNLVG